MIRALLAWLDRRIDARIEAHEARCVEQAAKIANESAALTKRVLDRMAAAQARKAVR